jgi:hypothetical protein
MSGRLSNLSFNLVDWKIREQILDAAPDQLESLLCALELLPADDHDRAVVKRLDAGKIPEILHHCFVGQGLRVDRRRFATRAVELCEKVPDLMRSKLEELAFVGGSTRMHGDLMLVDPYVVLCCCDASFARRWCADFEEFADTADLDEFADAPPFVEFAGAHIMTRAMGGVSSEMMGGLSPELEPLDYAPLDQAYDPTAAAEFAAALEVFSIDSLVVPPRVRYMVEHFTHWETEYLGTVPEFVRRAASEIFVVYAQARARRLGVDVYWHSNP